MHNMTMTLGDFIMLQQLADLVSDYDDAYSALTPILGELLHSFFPTGLPRLIAGSFITLCVRCMYLVLGPAARIKDGGFGVTPISFHGQTICLINFCYDLRMTMFAVQPSSIQ